jgi:hypothetical protein
MINLLATMTLVISLLSLTLLSSAVLWRFVFHFSEFFGR